MGIFDKLFRKMSDDPFYEYRRDMFLPEKYQFGMNCFMDTIDDKVIRDRLYQDIRNNPDGYTISPLNEEPDLETGIPRLFSVKGDFVLGKLEAVSKGRKALYKLDKQTIAKLMSAKPNLEVSFFTETGGEATHAVKTDLKHFDFDKAIKIESCAVVFGDRSLSKVLHEIEEKEILDAIGDAKIVFDEDLVDKDLEEKIDSRWKQYGLPRWDDINDERFMEPLIHALNDELWQIRSRATAALGNIGNPRAVELLIKILKDANENVCVREQALIALGEIGDVRAIEVLVYILKQSKDWKIQDDSAYIPATDLAVHALAKIDDPRVVEPLIHALKDDDSGVRTSAARALVKIGDARAIEPLIQAFWDVDKNFTSGREEFIRILGETGDTRVIEPLVQTIIESLREARPFYEYIIQEAVYVLRHMLKIDDAKVVEPFIQALKDEDELVRSRAVKAFGEIKIGDTRAVDSLIQALRDEWWEVRSEAAKALGEIGDTKAIEPLTYATKDADSNVREEAAAALEKVRNRGHLEK